ncbi:hypothetical protein JCM2811A_20200 [Methylorubrum rhodinum]
MGERALAPAVGQGEEHGRQRTGATVGELVAHIDLEPAGPGLAAAQRQHWGTQTFIAGLRFDRLSAPWVVDKAMIAAI